MVKPRERRWPLVPIIGWLPQYQPAWLQLDLVAGLTLVAYAVPVSLAYAGLARLPPQMGLYCYLVAGPGHRSMARVRVPPRWLESSRVRGAALKGEVLANDGLAEGRKA
jgi:hypothetical protein